MRISHAWLQEFYPFTWSPREVADILTMLGIEVESIDSPAEKFAGFVTAKVLEKEKHPKADKLSVCKVDDGETVRTVICGAPNVAAGQHIILAKPGAVVPHNGMKIEARPLRGVESQGMICSEVELGIGEDHSGIMVLPEDVPVGQSVAEYLQQTDTLYEISVTPNRADCLSHLGIARELAAYARTQLAEPCADLQEGTGLTENAVRVYIEDPENCPRYAARVVKNVKIGESPAWLKSRLEALGLRPRNVVVDVTNYVMMECGQPLHAFDLDTLADRTIVVRSAQDEEKFTTLDSKERTLDSRMLMICDAAKPVAVAGVMGGENSEITGNTTNVLIESAYFAPSSIRRTAKKLGISSDASYRFERGVDKGANIIYAADRAAQLISSLAGGEVLKGIIDVHPGSGKAPEIVLRYRRVNSIIGVDIDKSQVQEILSVLGFNALRSDDHTITVSVPTHRVDIFGEIDLIEEVARLYNYDFIPAEGAGAILLDKNAMASELKSPSPGNTLRRYCTGSGFTEILTQNQTDPVSAGVFSDDPVTIANPLGEEMSLMRPSMIPAFLRVIERNIRNGERNLRLFELGKIFTRSRDRRPQRVEGYDERYQLALAITGNAAPMQWGVPERPADFFDLKGVVEALIGALDLEKIKFAPLPDKNPAFSVNSLEIVSRGKKIGILGQLSPKLLKSFDIALPVYMAVLDVDQLEALPKKIHCYEKISYFPAVRRDLAFVIDTGLAADKVRQTIQKQGGQFLRELEIFDVYAGKNLGEGKKSLAFAMSFQAQDRTLVEDEVDSAVKNIIAALESEFGAKLRE